MLSYSCAYGYFYVFDNGVSDGNASNRKIIYISKRIWIHPEPMVYISIFFHQRQIKQKTVEYRTVGGWTVGG